MRVICCLAMAMAAAGPNACHAGAVASHGRCGWPAAHQIRSPREFFARCEADLKDPLVMAGEQYFELHRGTYTSQARNKKWNRQSELFAADVEMLSALALVTRGTTTRRCLQKLWRLVLTNQFTISFLARRLARSTRIQRKITNCDGTGNGVACQGAP